MTIETHIATTQTRSETMRYDKLTLHLAELVKDIN